MCQMLAFHRQASSLLTALCLWLNACTTWTAIEISELADHDRVRVTTAAGERYEIRAPVVETDSIVGRVGQAETQISITDVSALEASRFSGERTIALVIVVPLIAAATWYVGAIILCGGYCDD